MLLDRRCEFLQGPAVGGGNQTRPFLSNRRSERNNQAVGMPLFSVSSDLRHKPDCRHRDVLRGNFATAGRGQEARSLYHMIIIVKWFTLPHKHNTAQFTGRLVSDLPKLGHYFSGLQMTFESQSASCAKITAHR